MSRKAKKRRGVDLQDMASELAREVLRRINAGETLTDANLMLFLMHNGLARRLAQQILYSVRHVGQRCIHCGGLKNYLCVACWDAKRDEPGACIICRGTGRTAAWVQ
jgi:hypothetical protein